MSVRAYHLRRKAYRQTAKPVGIPGKPSTTNRAYRRRHLQVLRQDDPYTAARDSYVAGVEGFMETP